jgi:hypothetical protein
MFPTLARTGHGRNTVFRHGHVPLEASDGTEPNGSRPACDAAALVSPGNARYGVRAMADRLCGFPPDDRATLCYHDSSSGPARPPVAAGP